MTRKELTQDVSQPCTLCGFPDFRFSIFRIRTQDRVVEPWRHCTWFLKYMPFQLNERSSSAMQVV